VDQTTPDTVALDVVAAVTHIRSVAGGGARRVLTVGFCFEGRVSFNQAARGHELAGAIGFYGRVEPRDAIDKNAPNLLASAYACPILGLLGGADREAAVTPVCLSPIQDLAHILGIGYLAHVLGIGYL
jgi:carboxymethylenebutenolidase